VWTSLFVHDRPRDLSLSCLGIVSAGTLCSLLFGQAQATLIYLLSGLTGNLLKLGVDLLGRRLTGKLFLSTARDRFGVYVGDMGLGPSQSSCGSVGATLGLVAALWQVVVKELALRDVRALGPWARGVVQLNYFLAVLLGAATATLTILEALFPRFGKVNLLGGVFAGMLCGILLPYKTLRPLAVKPM
jgi:membrane associated rhomboid family serine protease